LTHDITDIRVLKHQSTISDCICKFLEDLGYIGKTLGKMTDSGKGKEKEIVGGPSTTTPSADALTFESGTVDTASTSAITTSAPKEVTGASTDPAEAPTSDQTELPSETTEGPSASAQQINPHVTVVSRHFNFTS
jgi:hypothetical protein